MSQLTMIISSDSCNGEENQFANWMNENYPDIETVVKNTLNGGLFDNAGNRVEDENYWDKYCSAV